MDTCQTHGVERLTTASGESFCPLCDAAEIEGYLARGEAPPTIGPGVMVVPAQAHALKAISIRLSAYDIERAKVLAKGRRLPYQPFVRQLLAEALDAEATRQFGPKVGATPATSQKGGTRKRARGR